ncbi:MAG: hypothetical protein R2843_11445 [Thermomicrobiales bacterium]
MRETGDALLSPTRFLTRPASEARGEFSASLSVDFKIDGDLAESGMPSV